MKTVCLPLLAVCTPVRAQAHLFLSNTKGDEFACSWLPCRRSCFLFFFMRAERRKDKRRFCAANCQRQIAFLSVSWLPGLVARFFVLCQFTFKGIVYPKLNLHPFCTHPDVEGGSGDIF